MSVDTSTDRRSTVSRRDMIKRALVAGGAGYVAPMILASASPASAQAISGTTCSACGQLPVFTTCNTQNDCICYNRTGVAGTACVQPNPIDDVCFPSTTTCDTDAECGPGELCIVACGTGQLAGKCHACCEIDIAP